MVNFIIFRKNRFFSFFIKKALFLIFLKNQFFSFFIKKAFFLIFLKNHFFHFLKKNRFFQEKNVSFLVISSNKIKQNLKKLDNFTSNIEEILTNSSEKSFNVNNLSIYEKFLFICVSPSLENFKLTYDTLNFSNFEKFAENRSKSSKNHVFSMKFIKIQEIL